MSLVLSADASEQTTKDVADDQLNIQEVVIENGLRVIVVNMKSNGSVTFGVGYLVGAGDDPRDVVGISHFLEHMMFAGTKNISEDKLKEVIGKYNKDTNAFTSYDITFYHHKCNKVFLDIDMAIEADRMQNLKLDKKLIEREKNVIIEERKMRVESHPLSKFMYEAAFKAMFLYSTYSYPVIGYLDQIKNCNKQKLENHYKTFYSPQNAFIVFVGDITMDEALKKVRKYFGSISSSAPVKRERVIDPQNIGLKFTIDNSSDQITIKNFNMIFKIDRDLIKTLKDESVIELIVGMLCSGRSSILYKTLVDQKELAYTLDSLLDIRAYDKGRVNIATVIREGVSYTVIEKEIEEIVYNFADKYLTKELLETEKLKVLNKIELAQDSPDDMQMLILTNLCNGRTLEEIKNIKNIVKKITFEEVKAKAKEFLNKENKMLRIYSNPKEK
jgi:zinc protease